ncbi:MAG: AmmeMemoRadiSam system radical SAM enzyme [Syntrophomonas sp.]
MPIHEALFYEGLEDQKVRCLLCPHRCRLRPGQIGICRVRSNVDGRLYSRNYAEVASIALDPIEKKPLYHFYPGHNILSIGTVGCNFKCGFCQNYQLAHQDPPTTDVSAAEIARLAVHSVTDNSIGLAFTYNEPGIWLEYILDVARILKEMELKVVLVSNGFIEEKPLRQLLPLVDAMNIDVKAFSEDFYRRNCKGRLVPVQKCVETAAGQVHVEATTLLIPGENDSEEEMRSLAAWLGSLNRHIPLHLSRYHPAYQFSIAPTDPTVMVRSRDIAREYLDFVYLGNLAAENNTHCINCQALLIRRTGYRVDIVNWQEGKCSQCGAKVDYIKPL